VKWCASLSISSAPTRTRRLPLRLTNEEISYHEAWGFDAAVITKVDLATAVEFNAAAANHNIQAVRPGMTVLDVSAKSGGGMERFLEFLCSRRSAVCVAAAPQRASALAAND
jgi:hypothetical protein